MELSERDLITVGTPDQVVAFDEALDRLAQEEPEATPLVKLVYVRRILRGRGGAIYSRCLAQPLIDTGLMRELGSRLTSPTATIRRENSIFSRIS